MFEKIKTNKVINNESGDLPSTTAVLSNNQIGRYIKRTNATILKNVFSATANGFGKAFYQPHDFTVLQDSYAFRFIDDNINIKKINHFIVASLNKIYTKYNWGNKSGWNKVKKEYIQLPITKDGKIDFEFMESFVAELEAQRFAELEAYLKVTGLNDYKLTSEEEKAIKNFESLKWQDFRIGDLFDVDKWVYGQNKQWINRFNKYLKNSLPVISGKTVNNGIKYYTTDIPDEREVFQDSLTISTRGKYSGTVTYHKGQFLLANNILIMCMPHWNLNQKLFIGSLINNLGYGGYSGYPRRENLKNDITQLPITKNGEIDFTYMETLISAIKKLVIKEVVLFADKKIEKTKEVLEKK